MPIDDPGMIEAQLITRLQHAPEQLGFTYLCEILEAHLFDHDERAGKTMICLARAFVPLMKEPMFTRRLREFYDCTYGNPMIQTLMRACFTDYPPSRTGIPSTDVQNAQTLISQPLGIQKARAREHQRGSCEALLFSPWPQVIEILCTNPTVQERDILFMASRRPTLNELLETILVSPWSARTEVRFALAANPCITASHAIRLALTLPPAKLEILAQLPEPHPAVTGYARHIITAIEIGRISTE